MPNPFPTMRLEQLMKILRGFGYEVQRQKGSHRWLEAPDRPPLCLAFHSSREISSTEVRAVLVRDVGLSREEALRVCRR